VFGGDDQAERIARALRLPVLSGGLEVSRRPRALFSGLLLILLMLSLLGITSVTSARPAAKSTANQVASPSPEAVPAVVREVLARGLPPAAPGQTLDLVRYTIQPGTTLAVHVHPGMQIAWVETGELTYHVLKGEVLIGNGPATAEPMPGSPLILPAGESIVLRPGDWVVEVPGAVHYGENLGSEPLVLWAATLLETDQPPSIPVNDEGTPVV
jgi:quercetin dioxygenase-like cupin family protein